MHQLKGWKGGGGAAMLLVRSCRPLTRTSSLAVTGVGEGRGIRNGWLDPAVGKRRGRGVRK
eukprot:232661-Chlamydomonas_euryale.AAC.1